MNGEYQDSEESEKEEFNRIEELVNMTCGNPHCDYCW